MSSGVRVVVISLVFLCSGTAVADVGHLPEKSRPNVVYMANGYDASIVTMGLGYGRRLEVPALGRPLLLRGELATPLFELGLGDIRLRGGARASAYDTWHFSVPVEANLIVNSTKNSLFSAVGLGSEIGVLPGLYFGSWLVAAELFWNQQWTTRIAHTDFYKEYGYADAKDGWLPVSARSFRLGGRLGGMAWGRLEGVLRGGIEVHGEYVSPAPQIYALLSINTRW